MDLVYVMLLAFIEVSFVLEQIWIKAQRSLCSKRPAILLWNTYRMDADEAFVHTFHLIYYPKAACEGNEEWIYSKEAWRSLLLVWTVYELALTAGSMHLGDTLFLIFLFPRYATQNNLHAFVQRLICNFNHIQFY